MEAIGFSETLVSSYVYTQKAINVFTIVRTSDAFEHRKEKNSGNNFLLLVAYTI
jgi:hypothetical protein